MNLAYRDIKHKPLRFVLTCAALSVLLGIVITMTGIYQGFVDDALRQARAANPDLWVVEAGTNGPFAASSRISSDSREMIARVYGVARAGSVTYQPIQTQVRGVPLRLFLTGFELDRPGGPRKLVAGRQIMRSHYEIIVDRSTGLSLGQEIPLGTRGHKFTVVGLTRTRSPEPEMQRPTSRCSTHRTCSSNSHRPSSGARRPVADHEQARTSSMPSSPRCRPSCPSRRSWRQSGGGST